MGGSLGREGEGVGIEDLDKQIAMFDADHGFLGFFWFGWGEEGMGTKVKVGGFVGFLVGGKSLPKKKLLFSYLFGNRVVFSMIPLL